MMRPSECSKFEEKKREADRKADLVMEDCRRAAREFLNANPVKV